MDLSVSDFAEQVVKIYNHMMKSSTTISKESTSQANGDGNGGHLDKSQDEDIVSTSMVT